MYIGMAVLSECTGIAVHSEYTCRGILSENSGIAVLSEYTGRGVLSEYTDSYT